MKIFLYGCGLLALFSLTYCAKIMTEIALVRIIPPNIIRKEKVMLINAFLYLYILLITAFYIIR